MKLKWNLFIIKLVNNYGNKTNLNQLHEIMLAAER